MMPNSLNDILNSVLYQKLILSTVVLLGAAGLRRFLGHLIIARVPDDSPHVYTLRKITQYLIIASVAAVLLIIWVRQLGDLSVAFGILAAGLAFALQEVIGSIAGWVTIISGQPFTIGDRIETGGIRGDVVDISVLRTTLMEIGNWLGGDHSTGRMVTVSNAYIFKEPLYNYSRHLHYVWEEITIPVTYESDWRRAMQILSDAVQQNPRYQELLPQAQEQRRRARRQFAIKITPLEPRVYVRLTDNWIELGLVFPVDAEARRTFRSEVSQRILSDLEAAGISIASQTMTVQQLSQSKSSVQAGWHPDSG